MDKNNYWDYLLENEIATENELRLITNINGFSVETLNQVLYSKLGYRDLNQYLECE